MGEHVVGDYKRSMSTFGYNVPRDGKPEERDLGWHASGPSSRSHTVSRFYSKAAYIGCNKIFEQVSVIAGHFHDEIAFAKFKDLDHFLGEALGMLEPAR